MRNLVAVAKRVLLQFKHDPRTIGIMVVAPCLVLWLFSVLLGAGEYRPAIAAVNLPDQLEESISQQEVTLTTPGEAAARQQLKDQTLDAVLSMDGKTLVIEVEGADASKSGAVLKQVQAGIVDMQKEKSQEAKDLIDSFDLQVPEELSAVLPPQAIDELESTLKDAAPTTQDFDELMPLDGFDVQYLHGSEDWTNFDFFGPVFIGIFIFVFVFLTSSMSLLTERSGGTSARLAATPAKGWQVVGGYVLAFGTVALLQSIIILWACITLIGFPNEGSLALVGMITVSMALVSLTLGLLVSGLAHTPFQVVQLMIVFVVPQILLSGIFDLSQTPQWMQTLASIFPVYYGADALRDVMLRGAGFADVATQIAVLWGFFAVFFTLAAISMKKKRAKRPSPQQ